MSTRHNNTPRTRTRSHRLYTLSPISIILVFFEENIRTPFVLVRNLVVVSRLFLHS